MREKNYNLKILKHCIWDFMLRSYKIFIHFFHSNESWIFLRMHEEINIAENK